MARPTTDGKAPSTSPDGEATAPPRPPGTTGTKAASDADPAPTASGARRLAGHRWATPAALGFAFLVLFPFLASSGIWDPYELDAGDLARRIAVNVFGARALALPNAVNTLPTLTDLRSGELGFTSMAVGFRVFGLHDWSGRVPLALWGFAGVAALYAFLARLIDRRAGLYATAALVTMPLYFIQARTMLGDVVTMAALIFAFCGLAGSLLDDRGGLVPRLGWLALGYAGMAAGYFSRGLLLGVATPAVAVGLAWLVLRGAGRDEAPSGPSSLGVEAAGDDYRVNAAASPGGADQASAADDDDGASLGARDVFGAHALLVGAMALAVGVRLLLRTSPEQPLVRAVGFVLLKKMPMEATFDLAIKQLGHALFPWSAFLPFAIGRLFRAPVEAPVEARDRETGVRVALLVGSGVAYGAFALLAPHTGSLPFTGAALLAGIVGLAILDLERGAAPSRALAVGTLVLGAVLYADLSREPDKALTCFLVDKPTFPKSFEQESSSAMLFVLAAFGALVALTWFEQQPAEKGDSVGTWLRERGRGYRAWGAELAAVWGGNLMFAVVVGEAALVGLAAMVLFGRHFGWGAVDRLGQNFATAGTHAWWVLPVGLALAPVGVIGVRDLFRALTAGSRLPRAAGTLLAALVAGGALSAWYYPALAAQVSPKEAFETYARLHNPGEPLGLLGVRGRAAVYYATNDVETLTDAARAFSWLTEEPAQRRFALIKAEDLPKLNALYRTQRKKNLPVLDGRSSQILLVSNELGDHKNENPLGRVVIDEALTPTHLVDAVLEDQLEVLGWDVVDRAGAVLESVVPQTKYRLRFYYRVRKPVTGTWKAFVHIDGFQRRYNGDHNVVDGKYPMNLWQEGDIVEDDLEFQLEPNFSPGDYTVFFGFFSGDTRMKVTRGPSQENRVNGGPLRVR